MTRPPVVTGPCWRGRARSRRPGPSPACPPRVRAAHSMTGYARDQFGPAWNDVDRNGCDTRNDILRRDLVDITIKPGSTAARAERHPARPVHRDDDRVPARAWHSRPCRSTTSSPWATPGATGRPASCPPSNGWRSPTTRSNLQAIDGPDQRAKGDGDAATWLPPNRSFRCTYVARQVDGQVEVPAVGDAGGAGGDCRGARRLPRRSQGPGRDRSALSSPRPTAAPRYAPANRPSGGRHPMERTLDPARLGDHLDRLYRAAWALCGSREDAEDLVQETYARVLARPRLLRNDDDLGYLLRALRNTFLSRSGPRAGGCAPARSPSSSTSSPTRRRASRKRRSRRASSTPRWRRCPTTSATCSSPSTSPASRTRRRPGRSGSARAR